MRVLVTGAGGQLGRDVCDTLSGRVLAAGRQRLTPAESPSLTPLEVMGLDRASLDVSNRDQVGAVFDGFRPDVVLHAAAWTAVDACEADPDRAYAVNSVGTRNVAEAARRHGTHVVYVSTDYVFDGTSDRPYVEWDRPNPMSVYGRSKLGGEHELDPGSSVVRTSWVCGFHGSNMVRTVIRLAQGNGPLRFVDDQIGSPTFTADLAEALRIVVCERLSGVFHLTNRGVTSWFGFASAVVEAVGRDPALVEPIGTSELDPPRPAPRPANSVLDNAAWRAFGYEPLPGWEDGLHRLVDALAAAGR